MARKNPFRGIVELMNEMDQGRHLGKTGHDRGYEERPRTPADAWIPTADVFANGDDLVIWMEVPGLPRELIDLTFADGVLTVFGERPTPPEQEGATFWKRERYYGTFSRSIGLPESVVDSDISAATRDGLLTITVSGACAPTASHPRRIPIGGGAD